MMGTESLGISTWCEKRRRRAVGIPASTAMFCSKMLIEMKRKVISHMINATEQPLSHMLAHLLKYRNPTRPLSHSHRVSPILTLRWSIRIVR